MSTRNPSFHQSMLRSPVSSHHGGYRSADRFQGRSVPSTHPLDLPPMDSQARYSISYVPGMSEHVVNTGKTLQEAQLKVVLLACEVERLNTLNYNLVKENEILKAQGLKPDREKDLEIKLAIVLAENEKLTQVIEELHEVYQRQRGTQPGDPKGSQYTEDYERRIAELIDTLDDWKLRYYELEKNSNLRGGNNSTGAPKAIRDLEMEKNLLTERLVRQEKDLEALRARLSNIVEATPIEGKDLQQRISALMIENEQFRKELEIVSMKNGGGSNDLQLRIKDNDDKLRTTMLENERLNRILNEKMRELQNLKNIVPESPSNFVEVSMEDRGRSGYKDRDRALKSYMRPGDADLRIQDLAKENVNLTNDSDRLNQIILKQVRGGNEPGQNSNEQLRNRLELVVKENERLNQLLGEKVKEIEDLKDFRGDGREGNGRFDQQVSGLLSENRRLNDTLAVRTREIEELKLVIQNAGPNSAMLDHFQEKVILVSGENERLIREVEILKRELSEARSNQRPVISGGTNVSSKDINIQLTTMIDENRKLNDSISAKNREMDGLKKRIYDLETTLPGGSNQMRDQVNGLMSENRTLNEIVGEKNREIEDLRRRLNEPGVSSGGNVSQLREQLVLMTGERDRLSRMLDERVREVQMLRDAKDSGRVDQLNIQINGLLSENRQLNNTLSERIKELDSANRRIGELEKGPESMYQLKDQMGLLIGERDRLNRVIGDREVEIDALKRQIAEMKAAGNRVEQLNGQINGLLNENQRLNGLINSREDEVERTKRRVAELESLAGQYNQQQEKVILVSGENERLNGMLVERAREIENLRRQNEDLRRSLSREQQLTAQVNGLMDENRRLNEMITERGRENEQLKKRIGELEANTVVIVQLREQINLVVGERDRANMAMVERAGEVEGLKKQVEDLKAGKIRVDQLSVQVNSLLDENKRLNDLLGDKSRESELARRRVVELEAEVNRVLAERDGANRALTERLAENDTLKRQVNELRPAATKLEQLSVQVNHLLDENQRLNDLIGERIRESDQLRKKVVELEAGLNAANVVRDQLNMVIVEKDRVSKLLADKSGEVEGFKRQVEELRSYSVRVDQLTVQINNLINENKRLNDLVMEKTKENEGQRRTVVELENGLGQTREQLNRAAAEKEDLGRILNARLGEIDGLKRQVDELKGLSGKVEQLNMQANGLRDENRRLNEVIGERAREMEVLRRKAAEADNAVNSANVLREQLNGLVAEKDGFNRTLSEKIMEVENLKRSVVRVDQLTVQVNGLSEDNRKLNEQLNGKRNEAEGLRRRVTELEAINLSANEELKKKVTTASAEAENLRLVLNDRTRESDTLRIQLAELRGVKDELDRLKSQVHDNTKTGNVLSLGPREGDHLLKSRMTGPGHESNVNVQKDPRVSGEVDRLGAMLAERNREVEQLRMQLDESRRGTVYGTVPGRVDQQVTVIHDPAQRVVTQSEQAARYGGYAEPGRPVSDLRGSQGDQAVRYSGYGQPGIATNEPGQRVVTQSEQATRYGGYGEQGVVGNDLRGSQGDPGVRYGAYGQPGIATNEPGQRVVTQSEQASRYGGYGEPGRPGSVISDPRGVVQTEPAGRYTGGYGDQGVPGTVVINEQGQRVVIQSEQAARYGGYGESGTVGSDLRVPQGDQGVRYGAYGQPGIATNESGQRVVIQSEQTTRYGGYGEQGVVGSDLRGSQGDQVVRYGAYGQPGIATNEPGQRVITQSEQASRYGGYGEPGRPGTVSNDPRGVVQTEPAGRYTGGYGDQGAVSNDAVQRIITQSEQAARYGGYGDQGVVGSDLRVSQGDQGVRYGAYGQPATAVNETGQRVVTQSEQAARYGGYGDQGVVGSDLRVSQGDQAVRYGGGYGEPAVAVSEPGQRGGTHYDQAGRYTGGYGELGHSGMIITNEPGQRGIGQDQGVRYTGTTGGYGDLGRSGTVVSNDPRGIVQTEPAGRYTGGYGDQGGLSNEPVQRVGPQSELLHRPQGESLHRAYNMTQTEPIGRLGQEEANRRLGTVSAENERLKRELDDLRRIQKGGREGHEGGSQLSVVIEDNQALSKNLEAKSREADDWRAKFFDLQRDSFQTSELRTRLQTLQAENDRLNALLADKQRELDELRRKYVELQMNAGQVDEFRTKFVLKCQENDRLNSIIQDKIRELETLRQSIGAYGGMSSMESPTKYNPQVMELQDRVRDLVAENNRLNQELILKSQGDDIRRDTNSPIRSPVRSPVRSYYDGDDLRERLEQVTAENQRLNLILQAKTAETEYPPRGSYKSDGRGGLGASATGGIAVHGEDLQARVEYLMSENERLVSILEEKDREIAGLRGLPVTASPVKVYDSTYRPAQASERKVKAVQGTSPSPSPNRYVERGDLEALHGEIDRLTRLLVEKEKEVDRLKRPQGRDIGSDLRVRELETRLELAQKEVERLNDVLERNGDYEGGRYQGENVEELLQEIEEYRRRVVELEEQLGRGGESYGVYGGSNGLSGGDSKMRQEVERLNRVLGERQREIEELTVRLRRYPNEEAKSRFLDDYRYNIDENPTGDLTRRFAAERQALEGEILGLRQKVLDLEEKVRILGDDNHQLSIINEERLIDVDAWKQRYETFERQKINEIEALRREYEERLRDEVERSARNIREGPESTIADLRREKLILEEKISALNREMDRLKEYLDSAVGEVEDWRSRYVDLENLRGQELGELKKQFENFRRTNIEIKEMQVKFNAERTAYETQILQLQQKVIDLENQVEMLVSESERVTTLSLERLREIELWKKKYAQVDENYTLEVGELKSQLEMFKSSNYDVKQLAIKYSAEKAADQSQIKQLKTMNDNYKSELEKLYDLMNQRKNDFESLTRQNEELRKLYERMSQEVKEQNIENSVTYERFELLQKEIGEVELSREQYKKQAEKNSVELSRKNKELVDKIQELDILKMKYEEALANYQSLNAKLFDRLMTES